MLSSFLTLLLATGASAPAIADELAFDEAAALEPADPAAGSPITATTSDPVTAAAFTVEHIWVRSTGLTEGELPRYSATMRFPAIAEGVHAIARGQTPRGLSESSHCQLSPFLPQQGTVTMTCELLGRLTPGTIQITAAVRSEAGDDYSASVPVTLCPEEGCSSLFTVAVEPAVVSVCLGDDLESVTAQYVLNVPWVPVSSSLATAPSGLSLGDGAIRSGSEVALSGQVLTAGRHHLSIAVVDEFDGVHEAPLDIDVITPQPGLCGIPASSPVAAPELAETGGSLPLGVGATGLVLMAVGAAALARRPRRA